MVLGTAYFRGRIPYELFYLPHLMTLVIYVLATVHTLDDQFRTGTVVGKNRSQSFKWFAGSIAIYTLDQIWRAYHSSRETMVLSAATAADGRTVLLHVNRPPGFRFKPGQYASLNIPGYGVMWHPFSIGSDPEAMQLTFLIEVKQSAKGAKQSWTENLSMLAAMGELHTIKLAGPFGSPVADADVNGNVIAIGTGTGIVPMLSLMETRTRKLGLLGLDALVFTAREKAKQAVAMESNLRRSRPSKIKQPRKLHKHHSIRKAMSSVADSWTSKPQRQQTQLMVDAAAGTLDDEAAETIRLMKLLTPQQHMTIHHFQLKWRLRNLKKRGVQAPYMQALVGAANRDLNMLIFDVFGLLIIATEITLVGLTISWANLEGANLEIGKPASPTDAMTATLMWSTLSLVVIHVLAFCYRSRKAEYRESYAVNFDLLMIIAMCIAQGLWMQWGGFEMPSPIQQTSMAVFGLWRALRYIQTRRPASDHSEVTPLGVEEFTLIWVAKSADLIMGYVPELVSRCCHPLHRTPPHTKGRPVECTQRHERYCAAAAASFLLCYCRCCCLLFVVCCLLFVVDCFSPPPSQVVNHCMTTLAACCTAAGSRCWRSRSCSPICTADTRVRLWLAARISGS